MHSPSGDVLTLEVKVMKLSEYALEEILEKNLLFLVPFYIFTHEKRFKRYEADKAKRELLIGEYVRIFSYLNRMETIGKLDVYTKRYLIDMVNKVVENLAKNYEQTRKGVQSIMGGKVIEPEWVKMYESAIEKGLAEGFTKALIVNVENLMDSLGVTREKACELLKTSVEKYQQAKLMVDEASGESCQ